MKKKFQSFLGAILIVAFASPSKSEERCFDFGVEHNNCAVLIVSTSIIIDDDDKTRGTK